MRASVTTTFCDGFVGRAWARQRLLRGLLCDVGREGYADSLEGASHVACDVRACGNDLAILFDGGLLEAVEIVEKRLPFGLEALVLA